VFLLSAEVKNLLLNLVRDIEINGLFKNLMHTILPHMNFTNIKR